MQYLKPLSKKNIYYISKHRYYELKHFCLQYNDYKKNYILLKHMIPDERNEFADPVGDAASRMADFRTAIALIDSAAANTDPFFAGYILKAVTQGLSFDVLRAQTQIPCGRDYFRNLCRKFYYLLSVSKGV